MVKLWPCSWLAARPREQRHRHSKSLLYHLRLRVVHTPRCVLLSRRFQSVLFLLLKHAKCLQSTDTSLPVYKLFNQTHIKRCLNPCASEVFLLFRTSPHSWPGGDGEDEDDVTCSLGLFCVFSHSFSTLVAWQAKCSMRGIPWGQD